MIILKSSTTILKLQINKVLVEIIDIHRKKNVRMMMMEDMVYGCHNTLAWKGNCGKHTKIWAVKWEMKYSRDLNDQCPTHKHKHTTNTHENACKHTHTRARALAHTHIHKHSLARSLGILSSQTLILSSQTVLTWTIPSCGINREWNYWL